MKKQAGFTMIELVMVIVILGILAAFALPRFADLGGEARKAALSGALGSIKSAAAIVHAKSLASGTSSGNILVEGVSVNLVNAYPDAETIDDAAQVSANDFTLTVTGGNTVTVANGNCSFTYAEAAVGGAPAISTIIVTGNSGC